MLAENGANIVVPDKIPPDEALERIKTDYGVKVEYYKTDVASREQVTDVIERIQKEFGSVDVKWFVSSR